MVKLCTKHYLKKENLRILEILDKYKHALEQNRLDKKVPYSQYLHGRDLVNHFIDKENDQFWDLTPEAQMYKLYVIRKRYSNLIKQDLELFKERKK